jgi:5,10-methylenetetrahydromethanopterin reductase
LLAPNATDAEIDDVSRLVPDEVVQLVTAAGTADEVRAKVREYFAAGATCAVLYPLCDDVRYMIDVFADRHTP